MDIPQLIQVDKSVGSSSFEICYIFKFFAYSKKLNSKFKYIIRAEAYNDCFAIKFYCARAKHSNFSYSRILNIFSPPEVKNILITTASVIPFLLKINPNASFCFMGSQTRDKLGFIEDRNSTQRFRIYINLIKHIFGDSVFFIKTYPLISSCLFINRNNNDLMEAEKRIIDNLSSIYDFEI